jgi:hypothetical protein
METSVQDNARIGLILGVRDRLPGGITASRRLVALSDQWSTKVQYMRE